MESLYDLLQMAILLVFLIQLLDGATPSRRKAFFIAKLDTSFARTLTSSSTLPSMGEKTTMSMTYIHTDHTCAREPL